MAPNRIQKEISIDDLTPTLCFAAIGGKGCCLLESDPKEKNRRKSLIGVGPIGSFQAVGSEITIDLEGKQTIFEADPYQALQDFARDRKAFGFIGYHAAGLKEDLPCRHPYMGIPDFFFRIYRTTILFDPDRQKILFTHEGSEKELDDLLKKCSTPLLNLTPFKEKKELNVHADLNREQFALLVQKAKEYIQAGDIFQVVLSRTFEVEVKASSFDIYRAIRQVSPAPYLFFFEENEFAIAGASPELLISVENGMVESMPIAGTSSKDKPVERLLEEKKECAEHVMLVDLARNDLGAVGVIGSVEVTEYKKVYTFSHLHHIVSKVVCKLDPSISALEAFKYSFPAGTLSGAPKIRAMQIIDELEHKRRHLYGGAIVHLDEKGNLTSCIAIRMALIRNGKAQVQTGAGIVLDSDPYQEALETELKASGILEALQLAEGGRP